MDQFLKKVAAAGNYNDGEPAEHYSSYLENLFKKAREDKDKPGGWVWHDRAFPGSSRDYSEKGYKLRVKQFAPMIEYDQGDYGCDWQWAHYRGRAFVSRWDLTA